MSTDGLDRRRLRRAAVVLLSVAVVVAASVVTPPSNVLSATGPFGVGADKWLHLGAYWAVTLLVAAAFGSRRRRALVLAVAFGVALGAGVELVQATLPARAFDIADAAVNGVGAVLGAATYVVGRRVRGARGGRREGNGG
ncbi:VanZ family protein [Halopelagius longus]|uniref:VanZ family protein n=1 Tax=Halopelagius longus TaxID=1236180 RepID=A0A1H1DRM0_9EURY|nr:VanZ family protein [Halopelagius longus]RDI71440.1 VanZ family protein [Halopelagius longus]SDQ79152.1 VanZ like family protein [Halopelagius longus]